MPGLDSLTYDDANAPRIPIFDPKLLSPIGQETLCELTGSGGWRHNSRQVTALLCAAVSAGHQLKSFTATGLDPQVFEDSDRHLPTFRNAVQALRDFQNKCGSQHGIRAFQRSSNCSNDWRSDRAARA